MSKVTKIFTKVAVTQDYYANWSSGFKLPKTSLQLSVVDDNDKIVWQGQMNKTKYNTQSDMKRMLNFYAKQAGY